MAHHEVELELHASVDAVFAALVDIGGWRDWDPSIRSAVTLGESPPVVGSRYSVTIGFYGKAIEQVHEIVELVDPTRLVVDTSGRASGRWTFDLTAEGSTTHVRWATDLKMKGMARLLDRGLDLALIGLVGNAVEGLERRFG